MDDRVPGIPRFGPPACDDEQPDEAQQRFCAECRCWHEAGDPLCQHEHEAAAGVPGPDEDLGAEAERRAARRGTPHNHADTGNRCVYEHADGAVSCDYEAPACDDDAPDTGGEGGGP